MNDKCTFCGAPAKRSDVVPGNPEQRIYSCKDADCLNRFRALLESVPADTRKLRLKGAR